MTNALMSIPLNLAAGEPVRELDLAVSSGARRHRGMPFAAAPADRWDPRLTVRSADEHLADAKEEMERFSP